MALSPVFVELKAATGEFRAKIGEAAHDLQKLDKIGSGAGMKKMAVVGKAALLGIGGVATAVALVSLHSADAFEKSHARLEQSFANVHDSAENWSGAIGETQTKMEKLGFTNAQVQEGLANLVTSTKDTTRSFDLISVAADLARFKHISLADASDAVGKAQAGQLRPLRQLGIDLPISAGGAVKLQAAQVGLSKATRIYHQLLDKDHAKKKLSVADHIALQNAQLRVRDAQAKVNVVSHTGDSLMAVLSQRIGGQAAAASGTFAGKQERLKAQVEDVATKIGLALVPKLQVMVGWISDHAIPALSSMAHWIGQNKTWLVPLVVAIGSFATGVLIAVKAVRLVTIVMAAFGVEADIALGPIGLIVGGIALLAAGLVMAYRHSETFRTIAQGAFHAVGAAIGFVHDHWRAFAIAIGVMLGPVGLALALVVTHFGLVKRSASALIGFFTGPFLQGIGWLVSNVVTGFKFIADVWFTVVGALVHGAASAFGWVPGIGGKLKHAAKAFDTFHHDADKAMQGVINSASHWGEDIGNGIVNGITRGLTGTGVHQVIRAVSRMADGTVHVASTRLEIASPSRVFHRIGLNTARGLALGILAGSHESSRAAGHMASRVVAASIHPAAAAGGSRSHAYAPGGAAGQESLLTALLVEQRKATTLQDKTNELLALMARAAAGKLTPAQLRAEMLKYKRTLGVTGSLL